MPTDSTNVAMLDTCYERLKEDVLSFREKGKVVLLGDFNARVGKAADDDDVISKFGEDTCNASGNKLISLLREVELVACNGRQLVSEPEWTRVRPSLDQKSVIDYILMDEQLMAVSENVIVDSTDIGCSDHFLVWMEIGKVTKRGKKVKRVLRRWRLERFDDVKVRVTYQKALQAEVLGFTESISQKVESGMKGEPLVQEVVHEWEDIVNRVWLEKRRLCVVSQLDGGIMKINRRREVYKKVVSGRKELWDEYCRLRKEVKEAVREKKLSIWNEVVEKVNADFEGSRKEFWAFVGRRTKGKYKNITSLKSKAGVSVSSTQGKLEVLRRHYEELGKVSVDDNFEADWKEEVVSTLETCSNLSEVSENDRLDRQIDREEIAQCVKKLKNNKTGGVMG